ncbi:MAG: hypothetical protein AVDCRST_MAG57-682, partial [uncultured Blastococcus sp.]
GRRRAWRDGPEHQPSWCRCRRMRSSCARTDPSSPAPGASPSAPRWSPCSPAAGPPPPSPATGGTSSRRTR